MLKVEHFLEIDSKFRSKLSQQNITAVTTSKRFDYSGNVYEDLIQPSETLDFRSSNTANYVK